MRARAVALAALVVACTPGPAPPPGAPGQCAGACMQMRACGLGLTETPGGAPCEAVCENAAANGVDFGATCLSRAKTCEEARACPR